MVLCPKMLLKTGMNVQLLQAEWEAEGSSTSTVDSSSEANEVWKFLIHPLAHFIP